MLKTVSVISGAALIGYLGILLLGTNVLYEAEILQEQPLSHAEKNAWKIWTLLEKRDYTKEAIAGILGNIDQETGGTFEPNIDEKDGAGYGLIQWTPKTVLLEHIRSAQIAGEAESLETQVEVIDWELNGDGRGYIPTKKYPYSGKEFKQLKDVKTAARAYEKNRERPRDDHPERQGLAQKWFDRFTGKNSGSDVKDINHIAGIALKELGNKGGEKFWSWYGYPFRVEWCAVFVSWCGNQTGSDFERFAYCPTGIDFFKKSNKWLAAGAEPKSGAIIFFDWQSDGISDHVGLVTRYAEGIVYTVEGNSGDEVKEQKYAVNSSVIVGYGMID